jgi:uncharacterized membrane protein
VKSIEMEEDRMRMSSFIMGGILGAAATVYLNRNNNGMTFSLGQAGESVNKMVDTARNKMMNNSNQGLDKVEKILDEEPQTNHQVEEILEENNVSSFQTQ